MGRYTTWKPTDKMASARERRGTASSLRMRRQRRDQEGCSRSDDAKRSLGGWVGTSVKKRIRKVRYSGWRRQHVWENVMVDPGNCKELMTRVQVDNQYLRIASDTSSLQNRHSIQVWIKEIAPCYVKHHRNSRRIIHSPWISPWRAVKTGRRDGTHAECSSNSPEPSSQPGRQPLSCGSDAQPKRCTA